MVGTPTLLVRGEADRWCEEQVIRDYGAGLAAARVERLPDVGRLVPEEAPERMAELIIDFVDGREVGVPANELPEPAEAPADAGAAEGAPAPPSSVGGRLE